VVDVTRYGRKRRRTLAWFAEHPRAFEDAVAAHDLAELERHDAAQMEREPADDRFERQQAKWLEPVDPADFESAA
jgi:hypothetical protein